MIQIHAKKHKISQFSIIFVDQVFPPLLEMCLVLVDGTLEKLLLAPTPPSRRGGEDTRREEKTRSKRRRRVAEAEKRCAAEEKETIETFQ